MKKIIAILVVVAALYTTQAQAQLQGQGGSDPAAMMARMKERIKPQLIEKAKLTDDQADKVIQINFDARQQMRGMRDLSEDDRKKKMEEVQKDINTKYKAIPLTDDQVKAVDDFYTEMRKNMQQRGGMNGGGSQQ